MLSCAALQSLLLSLLCSLYARSHLEFYKNDTMLFFFLFWVLLLSVMVRFTHILISVVDSIYL